MSDLDFEYRLERMFAAAPAFADSAAFAQRVESRLDRNWAMRRVMIGVAGLGGGLIAAMQMIGSRFGEQVNGLGGDAVAQAGRAFGSFSPEWKALSYLPYSTEVLWMGAGLAVLAVALIATRAIEEF
ncbi:MAG: hypothetical protein ACXWVJ_09495 [Caulobacteraceae bacterium]